MIRLFLFRLLESYFRHRWLYLIPVILLLVSGIAFVALSKPRYRAHGILYIQKNSYLSQLTAVRSNDGSWWASPSQITSSELGSLLQTDAFVRAIIRNTPLEEKMDEGQQKVAETIEEVRKSVWVHPMGDNQVFIGATYEDAQVSVSLVSAIIENFLFWKANAERTDSEVARTFFGDLIDQYRAELESSRISLSEFLEIHPEPVRGSRPLIEQMEIKRIEREINLIEARYSSALEKEEDARLSIAQIESDIRQTYLLIDAPHLPFKNANSRREMLMTVVIFLGAGLLLSAGGITGSALLNRTFLVPLDTQQKLNLPVLAVVPGTPPVAKKRAKTKEKKAAGAALSEAELAEMPETATLLAAEDLPQSELLAEANDMTASAGQAEMKDPTEEEKPAQQKPEKKSKSNRTSKAGL
jgi:uncharacterized protein involved in exopolysaccharide biosynthesis